MNHTHIYTTVLHSLKNHFALTDNDYYVLDTIDLLSKKSGWCYKSKKNIANDIFASERTVNLAIKKLMSLGLLEKRKDNPKYLKPTQLWLKAKEKFERKIGEKYVEVTESKEEKISNENPKTTQTFPKTPKSLRTRKQETQKEKQEKKEFLDSFLKL